MKLGPRLFLFISGLVAASMVALSSGVYLLQRAQMQDMIAGNLASSRDAAMVAFDNYLQTIANDMHLWSSMPLTQTALTRFSRDWNTLGADAETTLQRLYITDNPHPTGEKDKLDLAGDGSAYSQSHRNFHDTFRTLKDEYGYYDVFLIDTDGNIIYSVYKELDYATNLITGAYAESGLGEVFRAARDSAVQETVFVDFAPYEPSYGAAASFIARSVVSASGNFLGVIAFQMPVDRLDALVGDRGNGVNAMVVGTDNLLRNNDPRFGENAILNARVSSPSIEQALTGSTATGEGLHDGTTYLQSAAALDFFGTRWAFIAEIDTALAFAPLNNLRNIILIASALCLAVAAASAWVIGTSLSRPIISLSGTLRKLVDGNHEAEIGYQDRRDEIGNIASSVGYFQTKLAEMEELRARNDEAAAREREAEEKKREQEAKTREAERERETKARETERKQEEEARQAREAQGRKEAAIAAEIAEVVQACAKGDFSRRLSLDGKEGATAELCQGVNRIGEVVHGGLSEISTAMQAIARGDLTYELSGQYDGTFATISQDINATIDSLKSIVSTIFESSETSILAIREISGSSDTLSKRTEQNAASLEETSAALTELRASVQGAAESAALAQEETSAVVVTTDKGIETVKATVDAMVAIRESSQSITKFTQLIDEIAFQTNLLALNAGVEAARAGDAGRGFAVVANEVRELASRSAAAAREIADFVAESNERVEVGVELTDRSMKALDSIGTALRGVSQRVVDVSVSAKEQSTTIAEITLAAETLDASTQENVAMFEEVTAAIATMNAEIDGLDSAVGRFDIGTEMTAFTGTRSAA